ncbi:MAG: T9SS type A sorting domain-containing protein [Bacteroidetes bacterium]|nr:MAG: T9SS type A sorting domain-containing protein [Bacteroidota bacterium]
MLKKLLLSTLILLSTIFAYSQVPIATVTGQDASGFPLSFGQNVTITGLVYGGNTRASTTGIAFTLIDNTGGINCFAATNNFGFTPQEGDSLVISGTIDQFNGLTQIVMGSMVLISNGHVLRFPTTVHKLDESTESELVRIKYLSIPNPADWTGTGSGFNVNVNNGISTYTMRIDNDVDLYSMSAPTGLFHLTGLGGQFDVSSPYLDGYQILPRSSSDIQPIPFYNIGQTRAVDAQGEPVMQNQIGMVGGVVYGVNTRASETGISFTIRDQTGGIMVYNGSSNFGYTVTEGDSVVVGGRISHFNGFGQIFLDTIIKVNSGNTLKTPTVVNQLNEASESDLVTLKNLTLVNPAQWTNNPSGFGFDATDGCNTYRIWLDNDCNLVSQAAPNGSFDLVGLGGQFDFDAPYTDFYQLYPRYAADLIDVSTNLDILSCDSYVSPSGKTWTTSGFYRDTIPTMGGCDSILYINLTITGAPSVSINGNSTACAGETVDLTASGATGYEWSWAGGSSSGANLSFTADQTTTYTVIGNIGNCADTIQYTVTVNSSPTVAISADQNFLCAPGSVTLTASGADQYSWDDGSQSETRTVQVNQTTTYTVIGSNTSGCTDTTQIEIGLGSIPQVSLSADKMTLCQAETVTITATGADEYSWQDGSTASTFSSTVTETSTFTVIGKDLAGCSDTTEITITFEGQPNVTITGSKLSLCTSEEVTLKASGADQYVWQDGSQLDSLVVTVTETTTYTVIGTSTAGCKDTTEVTVTVSTSLTPVINENNGTLSTGAFESFQWYLNGNAIAGATQQNYTPTEDGDYTVEVTDGNCSGISNAFTFTMGGVGLQENQKDLFRIFPNPSTGVFHLEAKLIQSSGGQIEVRNLLGQVVTTNKFDGSSIHQVIDLSAMPKGLYFVEINSGKLNHTIKLIKK